MKSPGEMPGLFFALFLENPSTPYAQKILLKPWKDKRCSIQEEKKWRFCLSGTPPNFIRHNE